MCITRAALRQRHRVILVHGPVSDNISKMMPASSRLKRIAVRSAAQMHQVMMKWAPKANVVVMNAAVADFTPVALSHVKLKKAEQGLILRLKPTVDILNELGALKTRLRNLILIGFALETGAGTSANARRAARLAEANRKLHAKNLDAIVLDTPAAMGADKADFTMLLSNGRMRQFKRVSKVDFARHVVALGVELFYDPL